MWPHTHEQTEACSLVLHVEPFFLWLRLSWWWDAVTLPRLPVFAEKGNAATLHHQDEVNEKRHSRKEAKDHSNGGLNQIATFWGEDTGGDEEQHTDDTGVTKVHIGPGGDADFFVQRSGEEDEQQQGEEEGCAADKLKEVERRTADAAVNRLLQDEGDEGQHHFSAF